MKDIHLPVAGLAFLQVILPGRGLRKRIPVGQVPAASIVLFLRIIVEHIVQFPPAAGASFASRIAFR